MTIPKPITGFRATVTRMRVHLFIVAEALKFFHYPVRAFREMKRLRALRGKVHGASMVRKYIKSGNRFFWNTDYCGFPSVNLKNMIRDEFVRNLKTDNGISPQAHLQTLIWGITNRCPLSCSHCYEWDNIDDKDRLSLDDLMRILNIFKENGIRHIQFSGGEPLVRFHDLTELVREASLSMDCWLLTSGFGFTMEKAAALHKAGLIGAQISLDHWEEEKHNAFRNNSKSYAMATEAVKNCLKNGIMVSLSLCATRDFVTEENMMNYALKARELGAQFIRILEPRAVGNFSRQNVSLEQKQVELLSEFSIMMNNNPLYRDFPVIAFFGYHQRILGCFGAGNRYLYADPNGDIHACPFCRGKMGNLLEEPFGKIIEKVRLTGCHEFQIKNI